MSKFIVLGLGSVGARHARNLKALGHHVIGADPFRPSWDNPDGTVDLTYTDWQRALADHGDAAGCVIASPTAEHFIQFRDVALVQVPMYLEKPVCAVADADLFAWVMAHTDTPALRRSVCGFQYLFNSQMPTVARLARQYGELTFAGSDDLLARYGPTIGDVMVSHPIATALRLFGPAFGVHLYSDGVRLSGHIFHQGGGVSHYDFAMDRGPRESWVRAGGRDVALTPDDSMYVSALGAWISWLEGGERDTRLSSLSEGLEVTRVLSEVKRVEAMV